MAADEGAGDDEALDLAGAKEGDPPEIRLHAALRTFFAFVAEHRDSWVVLHRQASELTDAIATALAEARREVMSEVTGLVRAGIDQSGQGPGSPRTTRTSSHTRWWEQRTR